MNAPIRYLVGSALVLGCAVLAIAVWQQRARIRELTQQAADAARERDALAVRLTQAAGHRDELKEIDALRIQRADSLSLPARKVDPVAAPAARSRYDVIRGSSQNAMAAAMKSPEFQRAALMQLRGNLDYNYAALFRRLNLPPAQLEKLKNLLVDREEAPADASTAMRENGMRPTAAGEMRQFIDQAQAAIDANVHELLGDEKFKQFQEFTQHSEQFALADQLERRLSYTQSPLQPEQVDAIVRVLGETALQNPTEPAYFEGRPRESRVIMKMVDGNIVSAVAGPVTPNAKAGPVEIGTMTGPLITDEVIERTGNILTPEQLAALRELLAEQQAGREMAKTLSDAADRVRPSFRIPAGGAAPGVSAAVSPSSKP